MITMLLFILVGLGRMISRDASIESHFPSLTFEGFMKMTSIVCSITPIRNYFHIFPEGCGIHSLVPLKIFTDSAFKTMFLPSLNSIRM